MMRRLVALLVLAAGLASCSGGGDRITVYSGRTENLIGPLLERFAEETGIGVDVRYGESADIALLIDEEGEASPADVFISQSPGAIEFLEDRLQPLPPDVVSRVDARFRSEAGLWVGLSGRVRVLVYDTELVDAADLPASILDLTDPAYAGRVAVAPTNGSFQDFVTAMHGVHGDETTRAWLEGLVANDVRTYANNTAIVEAVAGGEVEMGLVNHYYNYQLLAEDPSAPTENYVFPNGDIGSLLIVTGAGIVETAPNPELGSRLVDFLLEAEAQTFFSNETFEYPLAAGVEPAIDLPPLDTLDIPAFDLHGLGGGLEATREMIEASGLESA